MWIWNNGANNYGVQNSATEIGTNGVTRYIAPMQGFFVRAQNDGKLLFGNSSRVHDGAGGWFKKNAGSNGNNIVSVTVNSEAGLGSDEVKILFGSKQNEAGAEKLFSHVLSAPSLFLPFLQENLSVRYLTDAAENPLVPIMFKPGMDGDYVLSCNFDLTQFETVILEDSQLHKIQDMKAKNVYAFKSSKTDDQSRFILHFAAIENPGNIELPASVYKEGDQMIVDLTMISQETEIMVYDFIGRLLLQKKLQGETRHSISVNTKSQLLIVVLKNPKGNLCRKLIWINT